MAPVQRHPSPFVRGVAWVLVLVILGSVASLFVALSIYAIRIAIS